MIQAVLCADIGTSSLKTALLDAQGNVYAFWREPYAENAQFSPFMWETALKNSVRQLFLQLDKTGVNLNLAAITVSGNGPTIAADDFLFLWNEPLTGAEADFAASFAPSLFLPRLAYIDRYLPESRQRKAQKSALLFSGPEYLIYRLCGATCTILPEKRFESAYWTEEGLAAAGIEKSRLPPFVPAGHVAGTLSENAARELGLQSGRYVPEQVAIICGAPDFVVALIGTNTLRPGAVCDRAGSSEGINVCTEKPVRQDGVRTLPSIMPTLYNAGFLMKESRVGDKTTLDRLNEGIRLLEEAAGICISTLRVTGGQARDDKWNQTKSNATGKRIEITQLFDAELTGCAVLAFYALGVYASLPEAANALVRVSRTFTPQNRGSLTS